MRATLRVIFHRCPKLCTGFDVECDIQILKGLYNINCLKGWRLIAPSCFPNSDGHFYYAKSTIPRIAVLLETYATRRKRVCNRGFQLFKVNDDNLNLKSKNYFENTLESPKKILPVSYLGLGAIHKLRDYKRKGVGGQKN